MKIKNNKTDISSIDQENNPLSKLTPMLGYAEVRIAIDDQFVGPAMNLALSGSFDDIASNDATRSCAATKGSKCNILIETPSYEMVVKFLTLVAKYSGLNVKIGLKKDDQGMSQLEGQMRKVNDTSIVLVLKNALDPNDEVKATIDLRNVRSIVLKSSEGELNTTKTSSRKIGKGNRTTHLKRGDRLQHRGVSNTTSDFPKFLNSNNNDMSNDIITLKPKPTVGRKRGNALQMMEKMANRSTLNPDAGKISYQTANHNNITVISDQSVAGIERRTNIRSLRRKRLLQKELVNKS